MVKFLNQDACRGGNGMQQHLKGNLHNVYSRYRLQVPFERTG